MTLAISLFTCRLPHSLPCSPCHHVVLGFAASGGSSWTPEPSAFCPVTCSSVLFQVRASFSHFGECFTPLGCPVNSPLAPHFCLAQECPVDSVGEGVSTGTLASGVSVQSSAPLLTVRASSVGSCHLCELSFLTCIMTGMDCVIFQALS